MGQCDAEKRDGLAATWDDVVKTWDNVVVTWHNAVVTWDDLMMVWDALFLTYRIHIERHSMGSKYYKKRSADNMGNG